MKKLLLLAIVVLGISAVSFGQINAGNTLTATTSASAKLVSVLNISSTGTLSFGAMTVPQGDVTVTLSSGGERTVTAGSDDIMLLDINPLKGVPTYDVTGEISANFVITLPEEIPLGTGVKVNNFTCSTDLETALDGTGNKQFTVGADLVLDNTAVAETYSADFNVVVAYQ